MPFQSAAGILGQFWPLVGEVDILSWTKVIGLLHLRCVSMLCGIWEAMPFMPFGGIANRSGIVKERKVL